MAEKNNMNLKLLPWHSLKTRVTLFTLAIFVVSIWSLGSYANLRLREDLQRQLARIFHAPPLYGPFEPDFGAARF